MNKGYHLNITIPPEHNITSFWAYNFAIDLNKLQSIFKAEIFSTIKSLLICNILLHLISK